MAALLVLITKTVLQWSARVPSPELEWVFIPAVVERGAPFAAWYQISDLPNGGSTWLQLRICELDGECTLGARKSVAQDGGTGLITATRDLVPATYTVEVLVVRRDPFGVPRTVQTAASEVTYAR